MNHVHDKVWDGRCKWSVHLRQLCFIPLLAAGFLAPELSQAHTAPDTTRGYLRIDSETWPIFVIFDEDFRVVREFTKPQVIPMPTGRHWLRVAAAARATTSHIVIIEEGLVTETTFPQVPLATGEAQSGSYRRIVTGYNLRINTEPGARIYLGDLLAGTGTATVDTVGGSFRIRVTDERGRSRSKRITLFPHEVTDLFVSTLPEKGTSLALAPIPGASQLYQGETIKGATIITLAGGLATASVIQHLRFHRANDDYKRLRAAYRRAGSESEIDALSEKAQRAHYRASGVASARNHLYVALGAVYAANLIDVLLPPTSGYRSSDRQRVSVSVQPVPGAPAALHFSIGL